MLPFARDSHHPVFYDLIPFHFCFDTFPQITVQLTLGLPILLLSLCLSSKILCFHASYPAFGHHHLPDLRGAFLVRSIHCL